MKKTLLALAVIGTLSSVAYAGDNENTGVTVYGNIDVGVMTSSNQDMNGNKRTQVGDGLSETFVGIKGQENLGDGLKAIFKLEEGFNVANGTNENGNVLNQGANLTFGHQALVGLSSEKYGVLTLGRQNTLGYDMLMATDIYSGANNIAIAGYQSTLSGLRWSNSVKYTNEMNGFNFATEYSSGNKTGSQKADSGYAVSAGYDASNWLVTGVYQRANDTNDGVLGSLPGQVQEFWGLGGKYIFNQGTSLFGQYIHNNFDMSNQTNQITTVGVEQQLTQSVSLKGSATYDMQTNFNEGHRQTYTASVDYAFSKRTSVYAVVDYNKLSGMYANADYSLNTALNTNNKSTGVGVGLRHSF